MYVEGGIVHNNSQSRVNLKMLFCEPSECGEDSDTDASSDFE